MIEVFKLQNAEKPEDKTKKYEDLIKKEKPEEDINILGYKADFRVAISYSIIMIVLYIFIFIFKDNDIIVSLINFFQPVMKYSLLTVAFVILTFHLFDKGVRFLLKRVIDFFAKLLYYCINKRLKV